MNSRYCRINSITLIGTLLNEQIFIEMISFFILSGRFKLLFKLGDNLLLNDRRAMACLIDSLVTVDNLSV